MIKMAKLQNLYASVKPGTPVTSQELTELGISNGLAVHYVRAGWLNRLARGVFLRPESPLEFSPSLRLLERRVAGMHIGGKSALDWHGLRHNLSPKTSLRLYGSESASLPLWFTKHFPESSYHRLRLFDEEMSAKEHDRYYYELYESRVRSMLDRQARPNRAKGSTS